MAEPSNIRINPFTGTGGATNYVELTEKHIIPANSPYVIRLNEVPEKQDPSNMKMVYVNESTGAATSTTLTEVAATPGKGEFRPDYSTNAMEDKTWNTGLIEFSASDAGKIVQVTYTGTGTLAGVNSNHWPSWYTDRGDGSDGDFVPISNTTISGVKNYKSVFIKSGITVTVDKYVTIKCQDSFINKGTISSNGKGGAGGSSVSGSDKNGVSGSIGYSAYGGAGGNGYNNAYSGGAGGSAVINGITVNEALLDAILSNSYILPMIGGGGGSGALSSSSISNSQSSGAGGSGGGSIIITCSEFDNQGTISSNGTNGGNGGSYGAGGGGGGGGGLIAIVCSTINNKGTITVKGGTGGSKSSSYGGSNGSSGGNGIAYVINMEV